MTARIKAGTCSWTDRTLVESGWYPPDANTPDARLRYYAANFPIVENDATYYGVPAERQAELWVARTPEDFTMDVKAFASFTTHYTDPKRLPKDLRETLPAEIREKRRAYPKDLGADVLAELAKRFRATLDPLRRAGKLGVLLFQFPPWFAISLQNKEHLRRLQELFPDDRIAAEFRNATWLSERNRRETLAFLRDSDLAYVTVDEPQGFPSSIPPLAEATSKVAVVRFHGRNAEAWQKEGLTAAERFNYRYSIEELSEWVPRIRELAGGTDEVHVLMNNCYADHAVTNARQIAELLAKGRVS